MYFTLQIKKLELKYGNLIGKQPALLNDSVE